MAVAESKTKIPEGWSQTQFGRLFVERKKSRIKVEDAFLGGQYPFFTSGEKVLSRNDYLSDGLHLFLATGGVANVKFFEGRASYSSDTYCIASKDYNAKLLFYTIWKNLAHINYHFFEGSGLKHLQKADFKNFKILFPENPKEQQKIAKILTTIDEAIEKTDAIIEKNKRIKQGLMQDLFRYGIDEHGNIRSEKTHKFKTVKIGNEEMHIPEEWDIIEVGNMSKVKGGKRLPKNHKLVNHQTKFPYIRVTDFANHSVDVNELMYLESETQKYIKRYTILNSDVYISIAGTIGLVGIIPSYLNGANLTENAAKITDIDKGINNRFLMYSLLTDYSEKQIAMLVGITTQPKLSLERIQKIYFKKPKIEEQLKIVSKLLAIALTIEKEQGYKQKLHSIKCGLMEDLLIGKVRVNSLITN